MSVLPTRELSGVSSVRQATALAALAVTAVFVGWDLGRSLLGNPDWSPSKRGLLIFSGAAWGLGASLALGCGLLRVELRGRLPAFRGRAAVSGALDGVACWLLLVVGHSPANYESVGRRVLALAILLAGGALVGHWLRAGWTHLAALAALVVSSAGLWRLSPNGDVFPRLLLQGVSVVAAAHLLARYALRSRWIVLGGSCVAIALALLASLLLARSSDARVLLAHHSVHARTWTHVASGLLDGDADGASNWFGESDCETSRSTVFPGASELPQNGLDDNCVNGDATAPARGDGSGTRARVAADGEAGVAGSVIGKATGTAAGRDVLIFSIDSLRADVAAELVKSRAAIGPHARLLRTVSPAPGTVMSLSSTLRGRPFRQVRFDASPGLRGRNPVFDPSPSIADVLRKHGYRALTVPTHRYLQPETRVLAGFEALTPTSTGRIVPASVVAQELLPAVVASAPGPVCVFVHYMESHHPFRYGGRIGPDSIEGLKAAVRYVDDAIAFLIEEVQRARGLPAVVAIFGDHGEEFGEHGGAAHATTVYAEQVRIPLLLAAPGIPDGDFTAPVSTTALPATLLELLGLPVPDSMTTASLRAYLTGEGSAAEIVAPEIAVSEARSLRRVSGYTFERYRLVGDHVRSAWMLFDSREDPLETRDIARDEPDLLLTLLAKARDWDERF